MDSKPYRETLETWNKVASLYQEKFMELDLYDATYDAACNLLKPNAKVLEIGCGPGNITKYFLSKRPDLHIHGIDFAPSMIELAKANCPEARFSLLDCRQLDTLKETYDAIICGFCIPYLSGTDTEKLVEDCEALMPDGGLLYLSFVPGDTALSGYKTGRTGDRTYFYYQETDTILSFLQKCTFEITETYQVAYPENKEEHIILIAEKTTNLTM